MPRGCLCGSKQNAASPLPLDTEWKVGGRYKANKGGAELWSTKELSGFKVGELSLQDVVLLLNLAERDDGSPCGLVMPPYGRAPGWVALEAGPNKSWPLIRQRLNGSWEMKAKYQVKNPATLREGPSITSPEITEVEPGDEVLVLELGHNSPDEDGGKVRLRALVVTNSGAIGWMSPETANGDHLLEPVNLLSNKVVELHQRSLSRSGSAVGSDQGPRRSCVDGSVPWQVGGQYRVLEQLVMREGSDLNSLQLAKISAASLVTVSDIQKTHCDNLGQCPVACVTVDEGPEQGRKGWVRCAALDGRDLIDTRDQLEYDKVLQKMRSSISAPQNTPMGPAHLQAQMVATLRASQHRQAAEQDKLRPVDEAPEAAFPSLMRQKSPGTLRAEEKSNRSNKSVSTKDEDEEPHAEPKPEAKAEPAPPAQAKTQPAEDTKAPSQEPRSLVAKIEGFDSGKDDRLVGDAVILEDKSYLCGCNCSPNRPQLPYGSR